MPYGPGTYTKPGRPSKKQKAAGRKAKKGKNSKKKK